MALIKTDNQNYTDIANDIRGLNGSIDQYTPAEMVDALDAYVPDYGISFSSDGTTAKTYGYKVVGLTGNENITTIEFSDKATEIGPCAFYKTTKVKTLTLPDGIVKIGNRAFGGSKITDITLSDALIEIDDYAFCECRELTSLVLPDGITKIGKYAFDDSQLETINLPDSITEIGDCAFYNCDVAVTSLPAGVTELRNQVFRSNENLTEFTFHENIEKVHYVAIAYCNNLTKITFKGTPASIDSTAFKDNDSLATINVPWSEGEVAGAPWGATNATINYNYAE